jgi:hypothetical protein
LGFGIEEGKTSAESFAAMDAGRVARRDRSLKPSTQMNTVVGLLKAGRS